MKILALRSLLVYGWILTLSGQTKLDLSTQSRNVDFSGATATRPIRVGTVLSPTCQVGEAFFKSNAPAGQNVYYCVGTNTWMLQSSGGGGGGAGLPDVDGLENVFLTGNGTDPVHWRQILAGPSGLVTVTHSSTATEWDLTALAAVREGANAWNGIHSWAPSEVQAVVAEEPVLCNANQVQLSASSAVTVTATPAIADGPSGATCLLTNVGASPITLRDEAVAPGSNLRLTDPTVILEPGQSLTLSFNPTWAQWAMTGAGVRGFVISFWTSGDSAAGSGLTLYAGCRGSALSATGGMQPCYVPRGATLRAVTLGATQESPGSGETSTISLRKNDSVNTLLCTNLTNATARTACSAQGLSQSFAAGDFFEIQWQTPTWVSTPEAISIQGTAWFEY